MQQTTVKITAEEVKKVAGLARLALTDAEITQFTSQMDELLSYFEQLKKLDTTAVEPTTHAVPMDCPERADATHTSLPRDTVMSQAPQREEEYFLVPKMIDAGT